MRLEYRLNDETKGYPALWNYTNISNSEIIARMTCEYFIKDKNTYVVTATSVDPDGTVVIYIQQETFLTTLQILLTSTSVLKLES